MAKKLPHPFEKNGEIRNIFLAGFMCSGKSSTGRLLAKRLGMEFRDSDGEVKAATGFSPGEIIERAGLKEFRRAEAAVLREISGGKGKVIALGGGEALAGRRWAGVRKKALVIYLSCGEEELARRLGKNWKTRPLIGTGETGAVRGRVKQLMLKRRPAYEKADWIIRAGDCSPAEAARKIAARLCREILKRNWTQINADKRG